MIEPAGPDGDITFGRMPGGLVVALDDGGFVFAGHAGLVANPADVRAADGNERARLQFADQRVVGGEVILLLLAVGPFAAGAIKPDFIDGAVVGEKFAKLAEEILVVFGRIAVGGLVAIPRGKMNEALINFMDKTIASPEGHAFAVKVLEFMRDKMLKYQEETGDLFNLEATPGEGTSRRFAWADKKQFPDIIVANEANVKLHKAAPYYTNSTQLPVNLNLDLFSALDLQDPLQTRYTGGTVFHVFLGEKLPSKEATKALVRKISANYSMPYFSLTPSFSICPIHGYLIGEHEYCPVCEKE